MLKNIYFLCTLLILLNVVILNHVFPHSGKNATPLLVSAPKASRGRAPHHKQFSHMILDTMLENILLSVVTKFNGIKDISFFLAVLFLNISLKR